MSETTTKQRILSLKGMCASSGITLKDVIEKADLPYKSVMNALNAALRHGIHSISSERLTHLEEAAVELRIEQEDNQVLQ